MQIERLEIPDILLVKPTKHGDQRGFFSETFRADAFAVHGVKAAFVQDNHVHSAQKGVLRGLHFQLPPRAQGKLVRCTRGGILDVGVDIRIGSPTYGRHVAVELSAAILERRQGFRIACPEEVAFNQGYIDSDQLERLGVALGKSDYARYVQDNASGASGAIVDLE